MSDSYKLLILSRAAKELQSLREPNNSRIKQRILLLASNLRPRGSSKLTGREGWRIRAGDYRIIYDSTLTAKGNKSQEEALKGA
ncbi:hypothetical protein LH53_05045 [Mesotoga sp. TolDC]|nr:hypothetical protein LH53_05045 [Mesotoga sp. TolDC]